MSKRTTVTLCHGCESLKTEAYRVQGDSGYDHFCALDPQSRVTLATLNPMKETQPFAHEHCPHDLTGTVAQLKEDKAKLEDRVKLAEDLGIVFGMMKTSDKPEPWLCHTFREGSEFHRVYEEWASNIGESDRADKLQAQVEELTASKEAQELVWSDEAPKVAGVYWHRTQNDDGGWYRPEPIRIDVGGWPSKLYAHPMLRPIHHSEWGGQWADCPQPKEKR